MPAEEKLNENKKFEYFEYDRLISIDFGSTWTKFAYYDIRNEQLVLDNGDACSYHPSACLYSIENDDYDHAVFEKWGDQAEHKRRKLSNTLYIDKLRDKVEHLFRVPPNKRQPLDRLYLRAIIDYFKRLFEYIINFINKTDSRSDPSKNRYVMTYPCYWTPEQVAYLKSLVQIAGIIDENDHPARLIMYSEEASILRYLQEPNDRIKQGHKYLICDVGGSKVRMSLYEIKEPLDTRNNMKGERYCHWDKNFMKEDPELPVGAQNIVKQCEAYVLSKLSTPDTNFTLEDIEEQGGSLYNAREHFGRLVDSINGSCIMNFSSKTSAENKPSYHPIPFSLLKQTLNSTHSSTVRSKKMVGKSMLAVNPIELKENVFKPVCDQIINYLENIIGGACNSLIEAMILVGGFCHSAYLMEAIEDACKRTCTKLLIPFKQGGSQFNSYGIVCGAIMKNMDKVEAHDPTTRIVLDSPSNESISPEVFVFIDFGYLKTRVSYIQTGPGQFPDSRNIKHIMDWPGQSTFDKNLPTLDIMLIPRNKLDGNSTKKFISLKDTADHNKKFLKLTQGNEMYYKYYTFEKSKRGIIRVTHQRKAVKRKSFITPDDDIESLQIAQQKCSTFADEKEISVVPFKAQGTRRYMDEYSFTVTRQCISDQEFSFMYFDYLTSFLYNYIYLKTGVKNDQRFQFCITRDNHAYPDKFTLTDEDIYKIANSCGMLNTKISHCQNRLLVLERAEATAIHCRKIIDSSHMNDRAAHLHFLQIQLTTNQCLMLLNRVPFLDSKDSLIERSWHGLHKFVKAKNVPFSFADITSENLWAHVQTYQHAVLKKCGRHRSSKRFFDSNNMQIFKGMLQNFISTMFLDIEDGKKVHSIYICNSGQRNCCRVLIANMDILEFGMIPAIHKLASLIEGSVFNQYLYGGLQISDVFVMGDLLNCKDYKSYQFIEKLLLMKLRKVNFRRLDNLVLRSMTKNTQVTKVNVQKQDGVDVEDEDEEQDSIENIAASGSITYGLDPRNRFVERFASRTYAIRIQISESNGRVLNKFISDDHEAAFVTYEHLKGPIKVTSEELIPIIRKGSPLASMTSIGEEINTFFTIFNSVPDQKVAIGLYTLEEDDLSTWDLKSPDSKFDQIQDFVIQNCTLPTYPIVFKTRVSQTKSYKFWAEYGKNDQKSAINIRESILLKTNYN